MDVEIINNKYKILNKIGEGSFGTVYKAQHTRTNDYVAVKKEIYDIKYKLLKHETNIYNHLKNCDIVPKLRWFGKIALTNCLVMDLLGKSLQSVIKSHHKFSLKIVLQVAITILKILKNIHSKGIVHRDIKPDNFLFGLNDESKKLYIIDFGLSKHYINNGTHIEFSTTDNLIGSLTYTSINSHNFTELSRRDDLESLSYMLVYFYFGNLSWQSIKDVKNGQSVNKQIKELKEQILKTPEMPNVLTQFITSVKKIGFDEPPKYDLYINYFMTHMSKNKL
tara:strand:- start:33 stop:869 length:837 start_codon:yes stop_codon:yes gene_type:complete